MSTLYITIKQHDGSRAQVPALAEAVLAGDWAVANRAIIRNGGTSADEAVIDRNANIADARRLTDVAATAILVEQRDNGAGKPRDWKALRTATLAALKLRRSTK